MGHGTVLAEGRAIGQKIGTGRVRVVRSPAEMDRVQPGDVLVTDMTDPNWEPVMKRAARSSPTAVGAPATPRSSPASSAFPPWWAAATPPKSCADGALVTVSCAEGDTGFIYDGLLETEVSEVQRGEMPYCPIKIMMNVGNPIAGLRVRADAEFRRRAGAAGVHHQQQHRRASEGDPRLPERRPRPEEGGRVGGARPRHPARVLRRQAGRGHGHDRARRSGPSR